ncbi:MAG: hypothetical protein H7Y27_02855 [Gemmatimonadaceae bacterium]|nr:hypothetical protein [Chitinophagaceae bacterium]
MLSLIRRIQRDKWKHFFVGIAMGLVLQTFAWIMLPQFPKSGALAVFVVIVAISYGFELFSKFTGKGHYEVNDAIASVIGGLLGMGIIIGFQLAG